jgi:hypothetical protein
MHLIILAGIALFCFSGLSSAWAQDCDPLRPSMAIDTEIRNATEANANVLLRSLASGEIKNDYRIIERGQRFENPDDTNRWNSFIYLMCTLLRESSLSDSQKIAEYFKLLELSRQSSPMAEKDLHTDDTPGDALYDSKASFERWSLTPDWNRLNDMLVNDGSGPYPRFAVIFAPYELDSADYILEADIRVVRHDRSASFGLIARANDKGGYAVGLGKPNSTANVCYLDRRWDPGGPSCLEEGPSFNPGTDWHRYHVAVKGNTITLLVDGAMTMTVSDNRFLSPGRAGLWSSAYQLEVRSFELINP